MTALRISGKCVAVIAMIAVAHVTRGAVPAATELYWWGSTNYGFHHVSLAGGPIQDLPPMLPEPDYNKLTIFDGKLYWITFTGHKVMRANLDGADAQEIDLATLPAEASLALRGAVQTPGGGEIINFENDPASGQRFSPPATVAGDLAGRKIYYGGGWNDGGAGIIGRTDLDGDIGDNGGEILVSGLDIQDYPVDLALDLAAGKIYWTNLGQSSIQRANLDGTGLETVLSGVNASAIALNIVPEPGAALLGATGMVSLTMRRRRGRA